MEVNMLMADNNVTTENEKASGDDSAQAKIEWHQGFYGGIELELREWKDVLSFQT